MFGVREESGGFAGKRKMDLPGLFFKRCLANIKKFSILFFFNVIYFPQFE